METSSNQTETLFLKIFRNVVINRLIFSFISGTGLKYNSIHSSSYILKNKHYGLLKDKLYHGFQRLIISEEDCFDYVKYIEDLDTFKLFEKKINQTNTDKTGFPLVDYCSNSGKIQFIEYLKEKNELKHDRAVDYSCNSGSLECVKYVDSISEAISSQITNQSLDNACKNGNLEIVNYLVENKPNVKGVDALKFAIEGGHLDIIKVLESKRSSLVSLGNDLEDSINVASKNGFKDVIKYLYEGGKYSSAFSNSTVDAAVIGGHLDLVKYFIDKSDYKATSHGLNIASKKNYFEICKYLVDIKTPHNNESCIRNAIINGNLELVKYFKENLPFFQCSPSSFNYACYSGNLEMVKYLSQLKTIINSKAYHDAAIQGHLHILKYLSASRPDIICPISAPKMSVYHGHKELVLFFIKDFKYKKSEMLVFAESYKLVKMIEFIKSIEY